MESIADQANSMPELQGDFDVNFVIDVGPAPDSLIMDIDGTIIPDSPAVEITPCIQPEIVNVAIIDAGFQPRHPQLPSEMVWINLVELLDPDPDGDENCYINDILGYDFPGQTGGNFMYSDGHGMHIAGIVTQSARPPSTTLDQIKLMDLKFYEQNVSTLYDAVCAIYYAIDQDAHVMNLSWGFNHDKEVDILKNALDQASSEDIIVVTSAGNKKQDNDVIKHWPSNCASLPGYENMVAVGAATLISAPDTYEFAAEYSNYGNETVDLLAPGTKIESLYPPDIVQPLTGTSMAAAYVSQVVTLGRASRPDLSSEQIISCLYRDLFMIEETPDSITEPVARNEGVINIDDALNCICDLVSTNEPLPATGLTVYPQPFTDRFTIDLSDFNFQQGHISLFHSSGKLVEKRSVTAGALQELEFNNLPPGIYFYLIHLEEGLFSGKLVKQ